MRDIEMIVDYIRASLQNGDSVEEISNELGLCRQTIYNYCNRYGIDYKAIRDTIRKKVERLYLDGLTVDEIQRVLQCNRNYVVGCISHVGMPMRAKLEERKKVLKSNLHEMLMNPNEIDFSVDNILRVTGLTRGQYQRLLIEEPLVRDKIIARRKFCKHSYRAPMHLTEEEKRVAVELRRIMNTKEIADELNIPHSTLTYFFQCLRKEGKIQLNGRLPHTVKRQFMEELRDYINTGYSLVEISELTNMSEATLKYIINSNGLLASYESKNYCKADKIEELFLRHIEVQDIALKVDTSPTYVNNVVRERNLKERL